MPVSHAERLVPNSRHFPYSHKHSRTSTSLMPQKLNTKYTRKLTIHNINPHEILHLYTPFNIYIILLLNHMKITSQEKHNNYELNTMIETIISSNIYLHFQRFGIESCLFKDHKKKVPNIP